jgi:hypothetical protein
MIPEELCYRGHEKRNFVAVHLVVEIRILFRYF